MSYLFWKLCDQGRWWHWKNDARSWFKVARNFFFTPDSNWTLIWHCLIYWYWCPFLDILGVGSFQYIYQTAISWNFAISSETEKYCNPGNILSAIFSGRCYTSKLCHVHRSRYILLLSALLEALAPYHKAQVT